MCDIREALVVCCLFLNTVDCIIFSLVPKLVSNMDSKTLNDPANFVKNYTFGTTGGLGQVLNLKDGTSFLPLVGNSLESGTTFDSRKDELFSGNFGIEIPNIQKLNEQNEVEVLSPYNLGLLPTNNGQHRNSEGPTPAFRSNLNNFEYQKGKVPVPRNLLNGEPPSGSRNLNYQTGKVPPAPTLPNGHLPSQRSGFKEIESNSDQIPAFPRNSNGLTCDFGKQPINNKTSSLEEKSCSISPSSRFLNLETLLKGPIATLKISGDIYLNSDSFSIKPTP